jgi:hypothetical protein
LYHKWPWIYSGFFSVIIIQSFPHSWLVTGFVTRVTRRLSYEEQEMLTLPEHQNSSAVLSGVRVARSLVFCVVFCISLFLILPFFFWPLYRVSHIHRSPLVYCPVYIICNTSFLHCTFPGFFGHIYLEYGWFVCW